MITVGSITDWVGLPVLDRDGSKIGSMEAVYYDTSTEEPVFITVKVGLIGSSLVFVPLADAVVSPKDVRVAVDKKLANGRSIDRVGWAARIGHGTRCV